MYTFDMANAYYTHKKSFTIGQSPSNMAKWIGHRLHYYLPLNHVHIEYIGLHITKFVKGKNWVDVLNQQIGLPLHVVICHFPFQPLHT